MKRALKRGILGASTIIISKDIDKYAFICGSIFYETDVMPLLIKKGLIYLLNIGEKIPLSPYVPPGLLVCTYKISKV